MSITITKRNSNPLQISNSEGKKLVYTTNPQKEPPQIKLSNTANNNNEDIKKEVPKVKPPQATTKPPFLQPSKEKPKNEKVDSSIKQSNSTSKAPQNQDKTRKEKFRYHPKKEDNLRKDKNQMNKPKYHAKEWTPLNHKKPQINKNENEQKETEKQQDDSLTKEESRFFTKYQKSNDNDTKKDDKKPEKKAKNNNIHHQKKYIDDSQNLIDKLNKKSSYEFLREMKTQKIKEMVDTLISFDDSLLNDSKIFISIISLYLSDLIGTTSKFVELYSIFFNDNSFIIGPKLYFYFSSNSNDLSLIVKFIEKIFKTCTDFRDEIFNFFKGMLNSKDVKFSNEIVELITQEIDALENEIVLNSDKKQFVFSYDSIDPKFEISELTNNYKEKWQSIESYLKVMFNLTTENFFYSLRQHLEKLKNDELDPRDLYLYEKVTLFPCYTYNERSEHDVFIHFSVRAANYKENGQIKKHTLREIDWQFTERLSNRKLLFLSLSPTMEQIDAVAISRAKKGTIQNNTIPISFLQGELDVDKEYYMFEPIDHWNGPLVENLLNTNEMTLPKSLINPIVFLDLSNNLIKNDDSLYNVNDLFKTKSDNLILDYHVESKDANVQYYCEKIISTLKMPTTNQKVFLKGLISGLYHYLKNLENERGNVIKLTADSDIVKNVFIEIQKICGFKNPKNKWLFDDCSPEEFKINCVVDHEQYKPIKFSLNHHLTLINGAPGSGKTYLACELVKFLICSNYKYPILIITYKNVSLDNFLTNIADFLQEKNVEFIRIGGKPRTENKFILNKQYDQTIPSDIQKIKSQIMFLTTMKIYMNKCLNQIDNDKQFKNSSSALINEIDKCICVKRIMFDMFPFYSQEEEIIITNFFNPVLFIPTADCYLNCWILGDEYYDKLNARLHEEYHQKFENLFKNLNDYLNNKIEDDEMNLIDEIIVNHFSGDEKLFYSFLKMNKRKVESKDYSLFNDILSERHKDDRDALNLYHESNSIKSYLIVKDSELPKKIQEIMKQKFEKLLTKSDKIDSFKEFLNDMIPVITKNIETFKEKCSEKQKEYKKKEIIDLGNELSTKRIIAMTATRAAQYKASLDRANIQFMIIEEAGELTESMAFSIIPKSVQNLVMIGDYRQLRPTVEHKLEFSPYNYHISLFEKLVNYSKSIKSDNLFTLSIQRRMHPQISNLLRSVFYNNNKDDEQLNDDESTLKIKKPFGFPNHIQFWLHEFEEETENIKMRSHVNIKEAQICCYLFMQMLCRGYKSSEITIVSLYKGQKRQIERELIKLIDKYYDDENLSMYDAFDFENDWKDIDDPPKDMNELIEFRKTLVGRYVKCLDDFQGEENEVIIISLTRSQKPGFVKNQNRALVTLSRAKQFEFVIGNRNVFGQHNTINPLWQKISEEAALIDENVVHLNGISCCCCSLHSKKKEKIILNKPKDFIECRFNCCTENCPCFCPCDHQCHLPCHFHSEILRNKEFKKTFKRRYFCNERCTKFCKKGHQCDEMCGNCNHFGCPPCSHPCENHCYLCSNRCSLNCCHQGNCQCKFTGFCSKCHVKIEGLHGDMLFINETELVCLDCLKKYSRTI